MKGEDLASLLAHLRHAVGDRHVLTHDRQTRRFRFGYRFGSGPVAAVVRPGSLVEQWRCLQACVDAGTAIIMQAANTGLTGGSTPHGADYDRPVVIISTTRIKGIHLVDGGRQVICLPGATLHELERRLRPLGREPHSVIGSSCLGASVMGGVCNNSGGSLVRRGPAYTELALYARIEADGTLALVNHLGIDLGEAVETLLDRLDRGAFTDADLIADQGRCGSDHDYASHVRNIEADTPARFNADPRKLHEASGSAGKLALFAVRLDSFPQEDASGVFYIGTNDPGLLTDLRRDMLRDFPGLPIAAEYVHRTAFDIAARYGKDMFLAVRLLGTDRLPALFAFKARVDGWLDSLGLGRHHLADRLLNQFARCFPQHLPRRMRSYRDRYEHHLMIRMAAADMDAMRAYLERSIDGRDGAYFECSADEADRAFQHRFAVAGAAVRYRAVHHRAVEDIVALDIALPRNSLVWTETLPAEIEAEAIAKLYYGHFFCHVFHQDYVVRKGTDIEQFEQRVLRQLDARGAEYPAEHNVGHLYPAKPALADFYRGLDPSNRMNPGIGQMPMQSHYGNGPKV
ncbi:MULTISPECIES: D-lactate dehydrogenase [Sphingobium]|uniref:D-lactate dehydrogenase n=1 Tax=Sphingobium TaxID=165695 RepID=UPI00091254C8|nr:MULTISPECIES: D-lactate dehydrogenase [Sphingobium]SHM48379.1 D-lactate dehydrogenase [Sphingobium sp. YR657]